MKTFGRFTETHTAAGHLSVDEQKRRHRVSIDAQPMVARCGIGACGFVFEGSAGAAIAAGRAHRDAAHPAAVTRVRRRKTAAS